MEYRDNAEPNDYKYKEDFVDENVLVFDSPI